MVRQFLAELSSLDVRVWAEGDRLRCTAPEGVLTAELRDELRERKSEILRLLHSADEIASQQRAIVPLQPRGSRTPVFAVAGHNGDVFCYRALAAQLGNDQPFFGLQPPGSDDDSKPLVRVADLAAHFAAQIRAFRPEGPYVLAGYCAGGTIAYELAQQLTRSGATVEKLVLFAAPYPTWYRRMSWLRHHAAVALRAFARKSWRERAASITGRFRGVEAQDPVLERRHVLEAATLRAIRRYAPEPYAGNVAFLLPGDRWLPGAMPRWQRLVRPSNVFSAPADATFDGMLREPHVAAVADAFRKLA